MKNHLSIEIDGKYVHIAEGACLSDGVKIVKAATVRLKSDFIVSDAINDLTSAIDLIKPVIQSMSPKAKSAVVTVGSAHAVVREFKVPGGKKSEVASMVRNEMLSSYNVSDNDVIEFIRLGESAVDNKKELAVRAAAISGDIVDGCIALLKALKLRPFAMDINTNAAAKLLSRSTAINFASLDGKRVLYIDIGSASSTAYILQNSNVEFSRTISDGLSELDKIIAEAYFVSEDKANEIKTDKLDVLALDGGSELENYVKGFFYNFLDEIVKIIQYNNSRLSPQKTIEHIYISGEGSMVSGFDAFLQNGLNIPVEKFTACSNIILDTDMRSLPVCRYVNAAGALIRL